MQAKKISDIVFNKIEKRILSGEWNSGSKIMSEPQLAKELGVSRMSVREAIEKMVALDILTKRQGEGTFVNDLTPAVYLNSLIPMITLDKDNYLDILEFRLITDVESARLCAERCSEEIVHRLEETYNDMLNNEEDFDRYTTADMNFHLIIAEGSGNSMVLKVNNVLKSLLEYHQKVLYTKLGPTGGIKEHKLILDAIKNRDCELSAIYMRRHIDRTIKDIKGLERLGK
ncbi:FadR family transcriptional regulator [Clostridium swellfunianum]|uniref:FadR/GntR family transcriptional regulator n=1 Tax=Clostridium swellfunianum TaxID=1367462 RepID=UPI00202F84D7|nr:FadR/GntR family transcriptional regulator [Clostridium swellfunianum]MCM0649572.1 FadR family transcriptional regulator [Clostridium swellfunianum]